MPITPAADVEAGDIVRIAGQMTVIQVTESGMLFAHDAAKFKLQLPKGVAAEFRAKTGDDVIPDVPLDYFVAVGKAVEYTTVRGDVSYYFPLVEVSKYLQGEIALALVAEEYERRRTVAERRRVESNALVAGQFTREFADVTGSFKARGILLDVTADTALIFLLEQCQAKSVVLKQLSSADVAWIRENERWIRLNANKLNEHVGVLRKVKK
ncbi:MAG: hypothetical protein QM775_25820 [Pirellulales bacterium]